MCLVLAGPAGTSETYAVYDIMARSKQSFKTYSAVHAALVIFNILCCTALIVLQNRCMNAQTHDFVDSYCLSDNRMRAVVSSMLAVLILILAASLSRAVKSFRTYKMMSGINGGVFIALSSGFTYRLRAIRMKKWTAAILAVLLFELVPPFWQTITQYAITTENVFAKVQGSKVLVYSKDIRYDEGLNTLINLPRRLGTEALLPTIASFTTPQVSETVKEGVQTSVVREALVTNVTYSHEKDDLSFKCTDVVATVLTSCDIGRSVNTSFNDDGSYVTKMLYGQGVAVSVNSSYAIEGNVSVITTEKKLVVCGKPNICTMSFATCKSKLSLAKKDIIFTTSNRKVTSLRTVDENANINLDRFTDITSALVAAPERIAYTITSTLGGMFGSNASASNETAIASAGINGVFGDILGRIPGALSGNIPKRRLLGIAAAFDMETSDDYVLNGVFISSRGLGLGLFRDQFENELHARVCAAAAISLFNMWAVSVNGGSLDWQTYPSDEQFNQQLQNRDLFTVTPQAYMPVYYVWMMAAFFGLSVFVLAIIDVASFSKSKVNVRENNELALVDNVSNRLSFNHDMYIRVEGVPPNERLVAQSNRGGTIPNDATAYL